MTTKELLLQRPDIPDECVQDLVERAAVLQDEGRATTEHASAADIVRVAEELDIEPQYVEQAIAEWRLRDENDDAIESRQRIRSRGRTMMRILVVGLAIAIASAAAVAIASYMAFGWTGIAGIGAAVLAILMWLSG